MRVHFSHRYVQNTVIILDEGDLPHPRCYQCDMIVPWSKVNERHLKTTQCAKGEERKCRWMMEEELRESLERAF